MNLGSLGIISSRDYEDCVNFVAAETDLFSKDSSMRLTCLPIVFCFLLSGLLGTNSSQGAILISENFESYSTSAGLTSVWTGGGATLATLVGNPGQSAFHAGGAVNERAFASLAPTATESIRLSGQIFDDANSANERITIGLRNSAGSNIIEMGHYNAPSHYAARVVLFGSGDVNWVGLTNSSGAALTTPVAGWHTYQVDITQNSVIFSLDLLSDGSIDSVLTVNASVSAAGFNSLRFGGPSGLSSGGGGANFDNLLLQTVAVPEPSSICIAGLFGLTLVYRRRR